MPDRGTWKYITTSGTLLGRSGQFLGIVFTAGAGTGTLILTDDLAGTAGTFMKIAAPANESISVMHPSTPHVLVTGLYGQLTGTVVSASALIQ